MRIPLLRQLAVFALLALGLTLSPQIQAQTLQIDSTTADWIEGFANFVRWDETQETDPLKIGVINSPEVANYLAKRILNRTGRPSLEVSEISAHSSFEDLDIIFVGNGQKRHWETISSKCDGNGILSIGAQEGFIGKGGVVEFVVRKNRLRFFIDVKNAKRCKVEVSSKLLELALDPKR
ncbi:YfiR family protein [Pelagicoccus albus]|uniref:YfiR family protein n=1 Tax=Pelagicoccus albus TaxID=415222 RepID=A0A7X1B6S1_9BACT|nr:YfiR family protein [Pelagicoccus albus]MBC2605415.1 YfiR family protein [Pelagicoccus albus]